MLWIGNVINGGANNGPQNGLGGIWSWNNNGNWQDFDPQASKQIDDELRNQWKNTKSTTICFPITKGPWFSKSKNMGVYFCNVKLNHSKTKIKSVMQQNTKTQFGRQMKRTPSFQLYPNQNNNNKNKNKNKNNNKSHHHHNNPNVYQYGHGGKAPNNNSKKHQNTHGPHTTVKVTTKGPNGTNTTYMTTKQAKQHVNTIANNSNYHKTHHHKSHQNTHHKHPNYNTGNMYGGNNNNVNPYNIPTAPSTTYFGTNVMANNGALSNGDGSVCWSWKDDHQWNAYDPLTTQQIEMAYNINQNSVILDQGAYFGASHRRGIYMIQFKKQYIPHSFEQINTSTSFTRKVARTANNNNNNNNQSNKPSISVNDNINMNIKKDKHFKWREYYRPMTIAHFKTLKDKEKLCNICFGDFEEKELFENQCQEFKQLVQLNASNANSNSMNDDDGDSQMLFGNNDSDIDQIDNINNNENDNDNMKPVKYEMGKDLANKMDDDTIIYLSQCGNTDHYFHSACIARWLDEKGKCCHCLQRYAIETGNQPLTGRLKWSFLRYPCASFEQYGSIKISFEFDGGIQGEEHYHPGQAYEGDHRLAFLPNNVQGREALELTKIAWKRRLIFSIGASLTNKRENRIVWASIHFKTRQEGGQQRHGWPDETYFDRFKEELKAKGVTVNDIDDEGLNNIKNGSSSNYGSY